MPDGRNTAAPAHERLLNGAPETSAPVSAAAEVRRKAVVGTLLIGARGVGVRVLGLAGNVVLARLLAPSDFGTVALALSLLAFGTLMFDGGLGASLIRRPQDPTRDDLRNVLAIQLAGALLFTGTVAAVGLWLADAGTVAAVMMLALPFVALRGPGVIMLGRKLSFGPIAAVEVGEVLAYYGWATLTVALGAGVWGLATASIVKAATGTFMLLRLVPGSLMAPAISMRRIRALLGFGARVQGVEAMRALRDQGVTFGTFAIAGAATLGLWALAMRLLQIPLLLFESLWRISFPAMSQLLAAGEESRALMERAVASVAAASGLIASALAASAPALVSGLFGTVWEDSAGAIALACIGLQINGPVSAVASGYLFASDDAGTVLRSSAWQAVVWVGVSLPLLPALGVTALGLGYLAMAVVEAAILARAARRKAGARLIRPSVVPLAITVATSAAGWLLISRLEPNLLTGAAVAALGAATYVGALALLQRRLLLDVVGLGRRAVAGRRTS